MLLRSLFSILTALLPRPVSVPSPALRDVTRPQQSRWAHRPTGIAAVRRAARRKARQ